MADVARWRAHLALDGLGRRVGLIGRIRVRWPAEALCPKQAEDASLESSTQNTGVHESDGGTEEYHLSKSMTIAVTPLVLTLFVRFRVLAVSGTLGRGAGPLLLSFLWLSSL